MNHDSYMLEFKKDAVKVVDNYMKEEIIRNKKYGSIYKLVLFLF